MTASRLVSRLPAGGPSEPTSTGVETTGDRPSHAPTEQATLRGLLDGVAWNPALAAGLFGLPGSSGGRDQAEGLESTLHDVEPVACVDVLLGLARLAESNCIGLSRSMDWARGAHTLPPCTGN